MKPGEFKLTIRNTGPMPVDMTLVTVDEAIWKAGFSPSRHLERLAEAIVRIPFDWVAGDPYKIELFTANGLSVEKEIPVAIETPRPSARMFFVFGAMGLYVGILPVAFGILWLPFLRRLGKSWINFFSQLHGRPPGFSRRRRVARGFGGCRATPWRILRGWTAGTRFHARLPSHHSPRPVFPRPDAMRMDPDPH